MDSLNSKLLKIALVVSLLSGHEAFAARVYSCKATKSECKIRLEKGVVGDKVKVIDESARVVAEGKVVRKLVGPFAVIRLSKMLQKDTKIKKGYGVLVQIDGKNFDQEQAASFSYDEKTE